MVIAGIPHEELRHTRAAQEWIAERRQEGREEGRQQDASVTLRLLCDAQDHRGLWRINAGLEECLFMGNRDTMREWGHARDYMEMHWSMLQQVRPPEDLVIATGRQESVRRYFE